MQNNDEDTRADHTPIEEFEKIYRQNFAGLCNKAFSLIRDRDEAKDVVQTVFFNLWIKKEAFFQATSREAYLYQAVVNACLNYLKKNKSVFELPENMDVADLSSDDPEKTIMYLELNESLSKLINSLPPKCRQVFLLSRNEGLNYREISLKLNISVNTVEKHIVRALKALKQLFIMIALLL